MFDNGHTAHRTASDEDANWVFVGLDGETSSPDVDRGGRLIQAGVAVWSDTPGGPMKIISEMIGHYEMEWSKEAAQVHGFSKEQVRNAPPPTDVDNRLFSWLIAHGARTDVRVVVPVGFNVASFDLPFFRQCLPRTSSLLSHRAVDLNSVCFTYNGWDPSGTGDGGRFGDWKRSMKTYANQFLADAGVACAEHDAGFDAAQALVGWWWLRNQLQVPLARCNWLDSRLDASDPLRQELGDEVLTRLEDAGVSRAVAAELVATVPPPLSARAWFTRLHPRLGVSPVEAVMAGRVDEVRYVAEHPSRLGDRA